MLKNIAFTSEIEDKYFSSMKDVPERLKYKNKIYTLTGKSNDFKSYKTHLRNLNLQNFEVYGIEARVNGKNVYLHYITYRPELKGRSQKYLNGKLIYSKNHNPSIKW
jgi:hypothetical protein